MEQLPETTRPTRIKSEDVKVEIEDGDDHVRIKIEDGDDQGRIKIEDIDVKVEEIKWELHDFIEAEDIKVEDESFEPSANPRKRKCSPNIEEDAGYVYPKRMRLWRPYSSEEGVGCGFVYGVRKCLWSSPPTTSHQVTDWSDWVRSHADNTGISAALAAWDIHSKLDRNYPQPCR